MHWVYLLLAGLFEVAFAISLKLSENFTKLVPSVLFVIFSLISFGLLSLALQKLPVGLAYALWTGIGAFGTVAISLAFLEKTQPNVLQLVLLTTLLVSVIGLKLVTPEPEETPTEPPPAGGTP